MEHRFLAGSGATALLLHEAGANENDLIPIGKAVARGAAILSPRLPILDDMARRADETADFVGRSVDEYGLDARRVYAVGYSSGADLAVALLLRHPELLAGAVLLRAKLALEPTPGLKIDGTPVLALAGQHDPVAPPTETERLARELTLAGAALEVHWMNEAHELGPEDFHSAAKWLAPLLRDSAA